jgi:hypothetical protein
MFRLFVAFLLGFAVKTLLCWFAGPSVFVENEVSPRRSRKVVFVTLTAHVISVCGKT